MYIKAGQHHVVVFHVIVGAKELVYLLLLSNRSGASSGGHSIYPSTTQFCEFLFHLNYAHVFKIFSMLIQSLVLYFGLKIFENLY
jgi:hypothetical protein